MGDDLIGAGTFGSVYRVRVDGRVIARKVEEGGDLLLAREYRVLKHLSPSIYIPSPYRFTPKTRTLDMELCGPTMANVLQRVQRFTRTQLRVVCQNLLLALQHIHGKGIVHRDLKPANVCFRRDPLLFDDGCHAMLIDFGLAKSFRAVSGRHIDRGTECPLVGTVRYASMDQHEGAGCSRRSEIESLCYMMANTQRRLPWQGLQCKDKHERAIAIGGLKQRMGVDAMPAELCALYDHSQALGWAEEPEYHGIARDLVRGVGED